MPVRDEKIDRYAFTIYILNECIVRSLWKKQQKINLFNNIK